MRNSSTISNIKSNQSILISSCDYEIFYSNKKWNQILNDTSIDAVVWCVKSHNYNLKNPNSFAYCKVDKNNTITEISEKDQNWKPFDPNNPMTAAT